MIAVLLAVALSQVVEGSEPKEKPQEDRITEAQLQAIREAHGAGNAGPQSGFLNEDAAKALEAGSIKHGWSGALKLVGVSCVIPGLSLMVASGSARPDDRAALVGAGLGVLGAGLAYVLAGVLLDSFAADDFKAAAGY